MHFIKVKFDRNLRDLQDSMNKLMDDMVNLAKPAMSAYHSGWAPEADVYETEAEFLIIANLAGIERDNIEVSFHDNYLRIGGNRTHHIPSETPVKYHRLEMGHGNFERIFRIPVSIDEDGIEALFLDGLLTVRMKKKTKPESIRIDVKS
jgi:HSP20 family protein